MCLVLPARILARSGTSVEVEYADGGRAEVDGSLLPDAPVGSVVLVDRGLILERVSEEDAELITQLYADMGA